MNKNIIKINIMAIVPIENAVIMKKLIDEHINKINEETSLGVVSKLLEIIIKNGYGNIGFHSGVENNHLKYKEN